MHGTYVIQYVSTEVWRLTFIVVVVVVVVAVVVVVVVLTQTRIIKSVVT